jgi:transposase-like protein
MAQGKAFTKEERETIIESLKPYLEMGFSRNKSCRFIGLDPTTLSKWVQDDESLSMKLVSWENVNTALALANIHQALKNESILASEKGDIRMENSWKVVSKLEEGYKDKIDVTSDNKALPAPILNNVIPSNNSNEESSSAH